MAREKILLVDDDAAIRKLYERWLSAKGYRVMTAMNSGEALSRAPSFRPELVVLDAVLPDLAAPTLYKELKAYFGLEALRVVYVTGLRDRAALMKEIDPPAPVLFKPETPQRRLVDSVRAEFRAQRRYKRIRTDPGIPFFIDRKDKLVWVARQWRSVASSRLRLLKALVARAGQVVSAEDLSLMVWKGEPSPHKVQVNIQRLRDDLGPDGAKFIESRDGGYSYSGPVPAASLSQILPS